MTTLRILSLSTSAAIVALALVTSPALAAPPGSPKAAEPSPPDQAPDDTRSTPETRRRAAAELKRGEGLIKQGKYDEAIQAISNAYRLDPKTEHLYNLGVAYHLKGDRTLALSWYEKFLAARPKNRRLVAQTQRYVADLQKELEAEKAAEQKRKADALAEEQRRKDEEARQKAQQDEAERRQRESAERQRDQERLTRELQAWRAAATAGRGKRMLGTGLVVAGGAALGVAVAAALEAKSAQDELDGLETGEDWTVSRDWLHDRGNAAEKRALIFSSAGAGLVTGGVVLYYLGARDARRAAPAAETGPVVTPVATPGGAGVSVSARF